jgi:hypothetical protein
VSLRLQVLLLLLLPRFFVWEWLLVLTNVLALFLMLYCGLGLAGTDG